MPAGLLSSSADDREWDAFVAATPLGQFQQCSAWACYKRDQGWQSGRSVVRQEGKIIGGAQILWRSSRLGRVGFLNKGPVVVPETANALAAVLAGVRTLARESRLRAILVQAPDLSQQTAAILHQNGAVPEHLLGVIDATLLADLTGGWEAICGRMARSTAKKFRQAHDRGLSVRSGTREDLPAFFALMEQTCARQGEKSTNPASAAELDSLWTALSARQLVQLWLAEHEGAPVAGLLGIVFGQRLTLWKKGWNGQHADRRPNEALAAASFRWGTDQGCAVADFVGMDRRLAERLLTGRHSMTEGLDSRHMFNLRLGGRPTLLPESMIWLPNPPLAWAGSLAAACSRTWRRIFRRQPRGSALNHHRYSSSDASPMGGRPSTSSE